MDIRIQGLCVDSTEPKKVASFWEAAPGWRLTSENGTDEVRLEPPKGSPADGVPPDILFHHVPEAKAGKDRLHLDLYPTGRDNAPPMERRIQIVEAKVTELIRLGASLERRTRYDDPEDPGGGLAPPVAESEPRNGSNRPRCQT
jgi:hypothetical protein